MEREMLPGLRTLFIVHFFVALAFALSFLLVPDTFGGVLGIPINDLVFARTVGAAVMGYAVASWWAFRETTWERVRILVQMEVLWPILGALVWLWGLFFAGMPIAGWIPVVVLGGFALAFAYYYSRSTATAGARAAKAPG